MPSFNLKERSRRAKIEIRYKKGATAKPSDSLSRQREEKKEYSFNIGLTSSVTKKRMRKALKIPNATFLPKYIAISGKREPLICTAFLIGK
jgi:hypothetical protein